MNSKVKGIIIGLAALATAGQLWGGTFLEWNYNDGQLPIPEKEKVSIQVSDTVLSASGAITLAIKVLKTDPAAPSYAVQVNFRKKAKIATGDRFRLSFDVKGDRAGDIWAAAIIDVAPWTTICNSQPKINVTETWQTFQVEFTSQMDYDGSFAIPMLSLNKFPEGGTIFLGPIKLEKL
ncbi:MAG: hypothetical protein ACOYM3_21865 [Terrimicrobiaceae bacterium]